MSSQALESRFVGRSEELRRASEKLDAVAAGTSRAIAVAGEPGIGKTRLLAEIGSLAEHRGQLVLTGRAAEFERDLPFGLFVDALDEHLRMLDPNKFHRLGSELQAELAQLFPSLLHLAGESDPRLLDERYRAHRAVRDLLERLAAAKPLVLLLDDLHWADHASVELLSALLRRPPGAAVLIAVSLRPRQAGPLLSKVIEDAVREGTLEQLVPGPLTREEAKSVLPANVADNVSDSVYAQARGNPFYLEELARALSVTTEATPARDRYGDPLAEVGLPPMVTAALAQELSLPGSDARRLLQGAAVAGDPFDPELAAAAAQLSEEAALTALDELVERDLVRATNVPRRFRFRHPLLRRAVYDAAPTGWRLRAHERTADALAARGAAATARAHHVEQSARIGDLEAVALLRQAGMSTAQRAPASAARWFAAALRLLPGEGVAPQQRVSLLMALAESLVAIGRLEDGREVIVELLDLLPAEGSALRVPLVGTCAMVEHLLGRHREADDRLRSELSGLSDHGSPAAVELMALLAANRFYAADYAQMRQLGEAALAAASELGEQPLVAVALPIVAIACVFVGDAGEARTHLDEGARLVDAMSDAVLAGRLDAICYLAWAEMALERFEDSIRHTERGIAVTRVCGRGHFLPQLLQARAESMVLRGRLVEAIDVAERAVEAARLTANAHSLVWALLTRALASMSRDVGTAVRVAREAVDLMHGREPSAIFTMAEAVYRVALGESGEHARCADGLLAAGGGPGLRLLPLTWRGQFLEALARAELARGRPLDAEVAASHAEAVAASLGMALRTCWAQRARAAMLVAEGRPNDAAELALAAAVSASAVGACVEEARSRAGAGRALLCAGDRDRAIAELQSAATILDSCGAVRRREEVERELRRLGRPYRRKAPRGDTRAGALTARELEIAELAAARRTNREIASELFLSEKTVEAHLRNIFGKLGISSRRAIHDALPQARRQATA